VVDHDRAHVRPARHGRSVAELVADLPHDRCEDTVRVGLVSGGPCLPSSTAASSVPPHVRKSFAVKPFPRYSPRYSFSTVEVTLHVSPSRS
jgi:hypothetical protein